MPWTDVLPELSPTAAERLLALPRQRMAKGATLFHPGDAARGFVIVLTGRIEVLLTGHGGRDILLYAVEPGESCVQTTLGLMADEPYSGEAVVAEDTNLVLIPRGLFDHLMDDEPGFRRFVMRALGRRLTDVTRLLERVAFARVGARLAAALLRLARDDDEVIATQAELATQIGTAREVVSRQLETFVRQGWVVTERGLVRLLQRDSLRQLAAETV